MRYALVGNQTNNLYRLCKWMRAMGHDAELFAFRREMEGSARRSLPELVDPELHDNYPGWITVIEGNAGVRHNRQPEIERINEDFDVVITCGTLGVKVTHFFRVPVFHYASGGEINTMPWRPILETDSEEIRISKKRYRDNLYLFKTILVDYKPMERVLRQNGHGNDFTLWSFPEDVVGNRVRLNHALRRELTERYSTRDRVFLWLSRLNMQTDAMDYKAPEFFAEALAGFRARTPDHAVRAIVGEHGNSVEEFKGLVERLGLGDVIDWVPHQPYNDLLAYLSLDNAIVFDELAPETDEMSGIAREALSVGGVVVKAADLDRIEQLFGPRCPIRHAASAQECLTAMLELSHPAAFAERRQRAEAWARDHLHYTNVIPRLLEIIEAELAASGAAS